MTERTHINEWFEQLPTEVVAQAQSLLEQVDAMRQTETIYPAQDNILNALALTAPANVRVVILGQDPYHGPGQAMGLSFSVPEGEKLPPSLRNIYKEMAADLGCTVPTSGDLTSWARQGVLLLNTTLTVREHAANSHAKLGWKTFTDAIVRLCLQLEQPVVFLTWGRHAIDMVEAARKATGATANKFFLASTHPSPLSAARATGELPAFMGSRPFSRTNELLTQHGAAPIGAPSRPWHKKTRRAYARRVRINSQSRSLITLADRRQARPSCERTRCPANARVRSGRTPAYDRAARPWGCNSR